MDGNIKTFEEKEKEEEEEKEDGTNYQNVSMIVLPVDRVHRKP